MERFLEIRNDIKFLNTLDSYENGRIYSKKIEEVKDSIDEEILKYLEWDNQLFYLHENELHIFSNSSKPRFDKPESFGKECEEFYEILIDHTELDVVKYRYLDYLIEFGPKEKRYGFAQRIIQVLEGIISEHNNNVYPLLSPISRLIDVSVRFGMSDKVKTSINLIHDMSMKLKSKGEIRWCLELARLIRYAGYKRKSKLIEQHVVDDIIQILIEGKEYYKVESNLNLTEFFIWELVEWYKAEKIEPSEIESLILEVGKANEDEALYQGGREEKSSLIEALFLEKSAQLYLNYGFVDKAKELQVRIKNAYRNLSENELKRISVDFKIEKERFEQHLEIFQASTVEESLYKLSSSRYHVPNLNEIKKVAEKNLQDSVFMKLASITKITGDRKVFAASGEEDELTHEIYSHYGLHLSVMFSMFYNHVWEKFVDDGLTLEMLKERILHWIYFDEETRIFVEKGLEHFWSEDYISAMHILVPQFENAFRQFFHAGNNPTTVLRKDSVQHEQTFNQFLEQEFVKSNIDEDVLFMIKYVLVEELGYNLRNEIAHGLASLSSFSIDYAHIVVYLYFLMTMYKWDLDESEA
ncbi:DUF4209 domain-containing protein [Vallitalea guaymasensis]|uniref:DUF4209 domain-containing protein n=1 Tax=Vallitalea guaymasensis TaxID=1185412 RepID=UPI002354C843|nr:DUF4209 domain-containing protein [Vallitalea guaymasensis]